MKRLGFNYGPGVFVDEQGDVAILDKDGDEIILKGTGYTWGTNAISDEDLESYSLVGNYWLGSKVVNARESCAYFEVGKVNRGRGMNTVMLFASNDQLENEKGGVRAVVYI